MEHPVIDFHIHIPRPEVWYRGQHDLALQLNEALLRECHLFGHVPYLVSYLRRQGIDYAVIMAEESTKVTGLVSSEFVIDACEEADGPLFAFVGMEPVPSPTMVEDVTRLATSRWVKGVKLLPSYQHFSPDDAAMYPLYEMAESRGLLMTFHTGSSVFAGTIEELANPLLLEPVARRFPGLNLLLAHSGRKHWYPEAERMAREHPNVFLEISGLPPTRLPSYFPRLPELAGKMVFGSDLPMVPSLRDNIAAVRQVFGAAAARTVLWENGARLLGLESAPEANSGDQKAPLGDPSQEPAQD
jgi:hypothetical protein